MKKCAKCGELKPLDSFAFKSKKRGWRQAYCFPCQKKYKDGWYVENKEKHQIDVRERSRDLRDFVREQKKKPCVDCGGTFHPVAMDFDHLPGTHKDDGLAQLLQRGVSKERLLEEIAKCELVCSNCHRVRTWKRNQHAALV